MFSSQRVALNVYDLYSRRPYITYKFSSFGQIFLALKQCISWEWSMGWLGIYLAVMDTTFGANLFLSHSHCPSLWYNSPTHYDWNTSRTKIFPALLWWFCRIKSGFHGVTTASHITRSHVCTWNNTVAILLNSKTHNRRLLLVDSLLTRRTGKCCLEVALERCVSFIYFVFVLWSNTDDIDSYTSLVYHVSLKSVKGFKTHI
jgi:hypothetical protein